MKKNTEAIISATQDQTLRTKWIKANIDGVDSPSPTPLYIEFSIMWMSRPCTLLVDPNRWQSEAI